MKTLQAVFSYIDIKALLLSVRHASKYFDTIMVNYLISYPAIKRKEF